MKKANYCLVRGKKSVKDLDALAISVPDGTDVTGLKEAVAAKRHVEPDALFVFASADDLEEHRNRDFNNSASAVVGSKVTFLVFVFRNMRLTCALASDSIPSKP